ncbi:MAG: PKD domain-containing protein, partial [Ginsengibacter sp.]
MKKIFFVFFLTLYSCISFASHITGGEMIYEYIGPGSEPNTKKFTITLKLFRDEHTTGAPMPPSVFIGIFDNDTNTPFPVSNAPEKSFTVPLSNENAVTINPFPPCVNNTPELDYNVGLYSLTIELPDNAAGYTAAYQTCCRVIPLNNVFTTNGTGGTGSTYTCVIPPFIDTSPSFASSIDLICFNREFTLNFRATDIDGDSLAYSFIEAYNGGRATNASNIDPEAPPYNSVTYINGFTSASPLGNAATINPETGIITGIAPAAGKYVVSVRVRSFKNRKYVGEHRKDFIINVGDCDVAGATLNANPVMCSGYSVTFSNDNPSSLNKTFFWDFGDPKSGALNTSTSAIPTHQFSDTGVFVYKLIVNQGQACPDTASQIVKVYPGFTPGFTSVGQCKNTPISFTDTTKSRFGIVNSWAWDFGDRQRTDDTSHQKNPSYIFNPSDDYTVQLTVTDSKGCIGTVPVSVAIKDKPDFTITNDTLICTIDTLQLTASGTGTFLWTPAYAINNQTISSPLVSPDIPTKYHVDFADNYGCKGSDSVFVDVKNFVTLNAGNDTSICATDAILLTPVSDALQYKWSPSNSLNNDTFKNPTATPLSNTAYTVIASIGKCNSTDVINVRSTPYPSANAGIDSSICL